MQYRAFIISLGFGVLSGLASCGGNTEQSPQNAPQTGSSLDVKALFTQKCQMCHGAEGTLTAAGVKPLAESTLDTAAVIHQIQKGKNTMPAFETQLSAQEIEALADYVMTLRK